MGEPMSTAVDGWGLRSVSPELARLYRAEGWWTDATLGGMTAEGLAAMGRRGFRGPLAGPGPGGALSPTSTGRHGPWPAPSSPGGSVPGPWWSSSSRTGWRRASPSGPRPTWARWSSPSSTSTGPRRSTTSSRPRRPDVIVTADRFGHSDYLSTYGALVERRPVPLWLVVGDTPGPSLPGGATPFASMLDGEPLVDAGGRRP